MPLFAHFAMPIYLAAEAVRSRCLFLHILLCLFLTNLGINLADVAIRPRCLFSLYPIKALYLHLWQFAMPFPVPN